MKGAYQRREVNDREGVTANPPANQLWRQLLRWGAGLWSNLKGVSDLYALLGKDLRRFLKYCEIKGLPWIGDTFHLFFLGAHSLSLLLRR